MLLFLSFGSFLLRLAAWTLLRLLFHEPPRRKPTGIPIASAPQRSLQPNSGSGIGQRLDPTSQQSADFHQLLCHKLVLLLRGQAAGMAQAYIQA